MQLDEAFIIFFLIIPNFWLVVYSYDKNKKIKY